MGIGCRRDPLEANVWYVHAAEKGNETAKQRLQIIRQAASGDPGIPMSKGEAKSKELGAGGVGGKKKFMGIF
jgi:TPR repeat protein